MVVVVDSALLVVVEKPGRSEPARTFVHDWCARFCMYARLAAGVRIEFVIINSSRCDCCLTQKRHTHISVSNKQTCLHARTVT